MRPTEPPTTPASRSRTRRLRDTAAEPPSGPVVLDRYRLVRRLGAGAFGTVWMARDERLERDVAVKILPRERIVGGRFEREARAAARLSHPAIVTLYEAAVDDDGAYLVSELVNGSTLDGLLEEGLLSDRDIVTVGIALCDALEHAHAQGVVHRDVKPSNVLVPDAPPSAAQVAKLTDFGVARVVGGESLTSTGDVIGTLAYMAPEQAEGLEAGSPADLYSLALVIYEALSGLNPIAQTATQRSRRLGAHLPPVRRQRRDLPRELGQAIDMALRPRPRERGTVAELRRALAGVVAQVGDEPGIVEGPATPWTTVRTRTEARHDVLLPADGEVPPPHERRSLWPAMPAGGPGGPDEHSEARRHAGLARGLAAAAAAAMTAWLVDTALAGGPGGAGGAVSPALGALLAAGAVLVLPRLGWVAILALLCVTALAQGHAGTALVILIALLLPVLLIPGRPTLWPLAAAAPALGLVGLAGLAGAWPALAGRARTPWRRAALGAVGWGWLLLAAPIAGTGLYLPLLPPPAQWTGSLFVTTHDVLGPIVRSGALAPALVWALGAVAVPWLVRRRRLAVDVIRTAVWAAMLAAGVAVVLGAVHGRAGAPPGALVGAVAASVSALAPLAIVHSREAV
ncbi:MAG TPA: serine/threonine-protein kinase [Solirubrobacteraceae bacterium]|nr:serine/threonine-protein kinase [Solirubrobacteraceae bacterium]